jgi:AraC-like DNA-binding protein
MFGYALLSCRNLAEAAEFGAKYAMAVGPAFDLRFSSDANGGRYQFLPVISQDPTSDLYRYTLEGTLATFVVQAYDLYEQPPIPSCLRIAYPPPAHAAIYRELFGCEVVFNAEMNEVLLPAAALATPIACGNPANLELARRACEDILKEIETSGGFAAQVRQALLRTPGQFPSGETIAAELGLSARQLHRNLQADNTSYRKILDEARLGLAIAYLRRTPMTTEDIAIRLGFSDGANFRHAFRRWTGKNTSDFRVEA